MKEFRNAKHTFWKTMKNHKFMWSCHIDRIIVAKHCIAVASTDMAPVRLLLYCARTEWWGIEREGKRKLFEARASEHTVTTSTPIVVLVSKNDVGLHVCVKVRRFNVVTEQGNYLVYWIDNCTDLLGVVRTYLTLKATTRYSQILVDDKSVEQQHLWYTLDFSFTQQYRLDRNLYQQRLNGQRTPTWLCWSGNTPSIVSLTFSCFWKRRKRTWSIWRGAVALDECKNDVQLKKVLFVGKSSATLSFWLP